MLEANDSNSFYGIVYKATNNLNGKVYIGQTVRDLNIRINRHLQDAKYENKTIFHRAINKYGKENFDWFIVDYAYNQDELNKKEIYWIEYCNSFIKNPNCNGYNMTIGGYGASGENHPSYNKEVSKEVRQKISETLKDKYTGKDSILSKPVIQLSLDGEFVNQYESMTEAVKKVGNHIGDACNGRIHSAIGHIWIYEEDYNEINVKKKVESYKNGKIAHNRRKVIQLDMDENFIFKHDSFKNAIESVTSHSNSGNIHKCCKGIIKSAYGYKWMYEEDYIEMIRKGK